jgi:hypothetical protein
MTTVFVGVCGHGPGITGRAASADAKLRDELYRTFDLMRQAIEARHPDALVVVAAEHFANFFMNNMPASQWVWPTITKGPSRMKPSSPSSGLEYPVTLAFRGG